MGSAGEFGGEINGEHDFHRIAFSWDSFHTRHNDHNYLRIAEATNQKTQFYLNYFHKRLRFACDASACACCINCLLSLSYKLFSNIWFRFPTNFKMYKNNFWTSCPKRNFINLKFHKLQHRGLWRATVIELSKWFYLENFTRHQMTRHQMNASLTTSPFASYTWSHLLGTLSARGCPGHQLNCMLALPGVWIMCHRSHFLNL